MAKSDSNDREVSLNVEFPDDFRTRPANFFRISRILDEVQMVHCYVRTGDITDAFERGEETIAVPATEIGSIALNHRAFKDLHDKVGVIYEAMVQAGVYAQDESIDSSEEDE